MSTLMDLATRPDTSSRLLYVLTHTYVLPWATAAILFLWMILAGRRAGKLINETEWLCLRQLARTLPILVAAQAFLSYGDALQATRPTIPPSIEAAGSLLTSGLAVVLAVLPGMLVLIATRNGRLLTGRAKIPREGREQLILLPGLATLLFGALLLGVIGLARPVPGAVSLAGALGPRYMHPLKLVLRDSPLLPALLIVCFGIALLMPLQGRSERRAALYALSRFLISFVGGLAIIGRVSFFYAHYDPLPKAHLVVMFSLVSTAGLVLVYSLLVLTMSQYLAHRFWTRPRREAGRQL